MNAIGCLDWGDILTKEVLSSAQGVSCLTLCVVFTVGSVAAEPLDAPSVTEAAPASMSAESDASDAPGHPANAHGDDEMDLDPFDGSPATVPAPSSAPAEPAAPVQETGEAASPATAPTQEGDADLEAEEGSGTNPLYLTGGVGLTYLEGVLFSEENFVPEIGRLNGDGLSFSGSFGLQFLIFQLGARVTYALMEALDLGTAGAEFAIRIPIPVVEPFLRVGAGYTWTSDNGVLNTALARPGGARIDGYYLEVGAGLDVFLTSAFAIGVSVDGAFLNLTRKGLDDCGGGSCAIGGIDLDESGDALGLLLRGQVNARLEFP